MRYTLHQNLNGEYPLMKRTLRGVVPLPGATCLVPNGKQVLHGFLNRGRGTGLSFGLSPVCCLASVVDGR
ncbi:hypothetical protein ACF1CG_34810 [Streptomyces sp. NPDC014773]|uniref:hypothetical protein n=1 Tax=Streptomyces sp. NPDC014773 TaxID=3364908 RepID=UPI003701536F